MSKAVIYFALMFGVSADGADKAIQYVCWRWAWVGDVYSRKVYCIDWRKK